jgi:DNA helicase-2/ATP-dependent DNA helicase PcrA
VASAARVPESKPALNPAQQAVVAHGDAPLLVVAGAGVGKTQTLAHRVAALIERGVDPRRILLLTFSRRAAGEMIRRAARLSQSSRLGGATMPWAGTFHGIANRVLRLYAHELGLHPGFTVLDREDSADLLDRLRHQQGLSQTRERFPRKGTCLAIYSHAVNTQRRLRDSLESLFPWFVTWENELRTLFAAYVEAKAARQVLDYDDLLLYWFHLMSEPALAARIGGAFDHVLVDEYQDTNTLQAEILRRLKPDGRGVTVVGDDAQAIYSFRAAEVRNILDFPAQYDPPAAVLALEQNYRSTQPILDAANAVIRLSSERHEKALWTGRAGGARPKLVTVADELAQVDYVVGAILARRESGVPLREQAVLMRAAHHSDALELELGRRNIPFVKYGGLRFLEAAHVKDTIACLRWAENPRDLLAGFRVAQLLPGIGPQIAERACAAVTEAGFSVPRGLGEFTPPGPSRDDWTALVTLYQRLCDPETPWAAQLGLVRDWYQPHLERIYDDARARLGDLEQLEQLAAAAPSRERFLTDLALDPPEATGAEAGPPVLDEDQLILSTIHSAKGQEWDSVYLLSVADGNLPSDLATGNPAQIEEERRLLYVAMTRAKNALTLVHPLRFFLRQQARYGDRHVFTPRTRFIPDSLLAHFDRSSPSTVNPNNDVAPGPEAPRVDVAARLKQMWR